MADRVLTFYWSEQQEAGLPSPKAEVFHKGQWHRYSQAGSRPPSRFKDVVIVARLSGPDIKVRIGGKERTI